MVGQHDHQLVRVTQTQVRQHRGVLQVFSPLLIGQKSLEGREKRRRPLVSILGRRSVSTDSSEIKQEAAVKEHLSHTTEL